MTEMQTIKNVNQNLYPIKNKSNETTNISLVKEFNLSSLSISGHGTIENEENNSKGFFPQKTIFLYIK